MKNIQKSIKDQLPLIQEFLDNKGYNNHNENLTYILPTLEITTFVNPGLEHRHFITFLAFETIRGN